MINDIETPNGHPHCGIRNLSLARELECAIPASKDGALYEMRCDLFLHRRVSLPQYAQRQEQSLEDSLHNLICLHQSLSHPFLHDVAIELSRSKAN
jgi:hypothetical protein